MTDNSERLDASLWYWTSMLLEDASIPDVIRGSGSFARADDGTLTFMVRSASRGWVALGSIELAEVERVAAALDLGELEAYRQHVLAAKAAGLDVLLPYAAELEAKRRAPLEGKATLKAAHIGRAVELRSEGKSTARIAQIMTAEGAIRGTVDPRATVRRWLRAAQSRTDRDRSA